MYRQSIHIFATAITLCLLNIKLLHAQDSLKKSRPAQITLVAPVGTNGAASAATVNHFSLNLLWGSSAGVMGAEFGGLLNQTDGPVTGAQFAGLGNINFGRLSGAQFAGLFNISTSSFSGFQASGLFNASPKKAHNPDRLPSHYISSGAQVAGLVNLQGDSLKGVQIAGIMNSSQYVKGGQAAGILNKAKVLSGVQFGLINLADTVENGIQIGLINIVKNGYRATEIESNESFYVNLNYKMGLRRFYSIFSLSFKEREGTHFWAPGLGFGTYRAISRRTGINIDATHHWVNEGEWWTNKLNILDKLKINASYQIAPRLTVYGGASINVQVTKIKDAAGDPEGSLFKTPNSFYNEVNNHHRVIIYPGLNIGLRF